MIASLRVSPAHAPRGRMRLRAVTQRRALFVFLQGAQDWSTALYKALEHAQRTLQTKIEELHVQRSRLGAHDDLIEVTKKNVQEESNQLQTDDFPNTTLCKTYM